MKSRLIGLVVCLCLATVLRAAESVDAQPDDGGLWIDLRSPQEYRQGHIEGAINIPRGELPHRIGRLVTDFFQPLHLYGSNAGFTGLALNILIEMGYQHVINEGSYQSLLARQDAP